MKEYCTATMVRPELTLKEIYDYANSFAADLSVVQQLLRNRLEPNEDEKLHWRLRNMTKTLEVIMLEDYRTLNVGLTEQDEHYKIVIMFRYEEALTFDPECPDPDRCQAEYCYLPEGEEHWVGEGNGRAKFVADFLDGLITVAETNGKRGWGSVAQPITYVFDQPHTKA